MNDHIYLYCERLTSSLWSEPLNAISNISFFIAALFIWRLSQRQLKTPTIIWILIALVISIGTGSFLFHIFATKWANLLDVIPILLFQLLFIWLYSRQIVRMNQVYAGLLLAGFYFASDFGKHFTNFFNGSLSYAPAFFILFGLGIYHYQKRKHEPFILLFAAGVFLLALTFRSIDQVICPYFSIGSHFLWHVFNGILIYLSARALILNWSIKAKARETSE